MSGDTPAQDNVQAPRPLDLAIILPTYNERDNVGEIVSRIEETLQGLRWELIFVDDDSPDGTSDIVRAHSRHDSRIRLVHRIGRRGLSSACIEGIMATSALYIAVMDADLQHDESILPAMLCKIQNESLDIVVGTRNAHNGSMGEFCKKRVLLSRLGRKISNLVCRCELSDPMSGFFLLHRSFFLEIVDDLEGRGFKILVDMLSSSQRPVRIGEVGYCFRKRIHGESKLDANTAIEYLFLVANKLTGNIIPQRLAVFSLIAAAGVFTYLFCIALMLPVLHLRFMSAQAVSTFIAMTENFLLNNLFTSRDRSLRGISLASGLASFWIACSFGAWANVVFADSLLHSGESWYIAGLAGIVLSSAWNYSVLSLFNWRTPRRNKTMTAMEYSTSNQHL